MANQIEQVASKVRDPNDPYVRGWEEGKAFAEDRFAAMQRLEHGDSKNILFTMDRKVWSEANAVWQREANSPNTYMSPESLLKWITIRVPEMKYFMSWAEGQGHIKGFLEGKGIKAKTGGL